ncbi:hypothetical protein Salat_2797700 [Sesamum alatum]|uniref:Uncharacterized protein n=1 Tax=Sesamum alatum TaxID=300844 RepID=A0AAE1XLV9_9LAMI|nr:hypothetical protein Salat_2797700 [Sesamum alatum]
MWLQLALRWRVSCQAVRRLEVTSLYCGDGELFDALPGGLAMDAGTGGESTNIRVRAMAQSAEACPLPNPVPMVSDSTSPSTNPRASIPSSSTTSPRFTTSDSTLNQPVPLRKT